MYTIIFCIKIVFFLLAVRCFRYTLYVHFDCLSLSVIKRLNCLCPKFCGNSRDPQGRVKINVREVVELDLPSLTTSLVVPLDLPSITSSPGAELDLPSLTTSLVVELDLPSLTTSLVAN